MKPLLAVGAMLLSALCHCSLTLDTDCTTDRNICPDGYRCDGGRCRALIWIPVSAGNVLMGSPESENGHLSDEDSHEVTLTHDFLMLATEVTQAEFTSYMGYNPSHFSEGEWPEAQPVESVTWHEAVEFCNALSSAEDLPPCYDCQTTEGTLECELDDGYATPYDCEGYRLPTEAEWELAARANMRGATYNGDIPGGAVACESDHEVLDEIAWFCGNAAGATQIVATRVRNGFGFFDILGNVAEWCHDLDGEYDEGAVNDPVGAIGGTSEHIFRGGSWEDVAVDIRAARRSRMEGSIGESTVGLRPVRTVH